MNVADLIGETLLALPAFARVIVILVMPVAFAAFAIVFCDRVDDWVRGRRRRRAMDDVRERRLLELGEREWLP